MRVNLGMTTTEKLENQKKKTDSKALSTKAKGKERRRRIAQVFGQ